MRYSSGGAVDICFGSSVLIAATTIRTRACSTGVEMELTSRADTVCSARRKNV